MADTPAYERRPLVHLLINLMETLETRLNEVARIAVRLEQQTACPAQLLIAQWAIESAWGAKPVGHANYFGLKRAARHTQWCTVETREAVNGRSVIENLEFADYDSLADSCRDYAWPIASRRTGLHGVGTVSGRSRSAHSDCGGRRHLRD